MSRVPISFDTGIRTLLLRPGELHPRPAAGGREAPELRNYFVAAGMNSVGILTGGGMGRLLAHWMLTGRPDVDVTGFNIDRLHRYQSNPSTAPPEPSSRSGWSSSATTRTRR
jgi:4-methylaminobutanoate oxidase (formaldehyde-forming)